MPADYKRRGNGRGKKPLPGFIWLLVGLGIGLFVALLVYLDGQPGTGSNFGVAVQKELDKIKQKPAKKQDKTSSKQEPKFNFYTILPELEVLIPESEIQPPKNSSSPTGNNLSSDKQYILQAGSFQNKQDAEKQKASLALLGYAANIQHVTINRDAWHRVRLGPYTNTKELYQTIALLHQHGISAMAMEIKRD
jgi:cell division protein FtsN